VANRAGRRSARARAGRGLELLVKGLEQLLAEAPVEIRSPDYIVGRLSGQRREVDVSLRSRVGSVDVLVIIECRDRSKAQGVSWIEQLASKREDVGADKAVAVSAAGFTPGAQNLARSEHVELRSFEELSADVVFDWLRAEAQISGVGLSTTLMTWGFSSPFLCVILKTSVGWVACRQRLRRSWRACQSPVISACTAPAAGASSRAVP